MNKAAVKKRIEDAIKKFVTSVSRKPFSLIPQSMTFGKLYEAHVLSRVIENLSVSEGFVIILVNSNYIPLKSSPGPINRQYPFFRLEHSGATVAELWTDVEFMSLSYALRNGPITGLGDYHELDILVTDKDVIGRPLHNQIWLGVECKNTGYSKRLLREILGVRRELSVLQGPNPTKFKVWPRVSVNANPESCLMVYSTDPDVVRYADPGILFGIDFKHEVL